MPSSKAENDPRPLRRAAVVLALVWGALFAPQLFGRQTFVLGDARVYRPFAEYSRERWLDRHVRTYWNPYVMAGLPASASLADMRPQYLPDAALDLFERLRPGRLVPLAGPLLAHLAGMCGMAALAWCLWGLPAVALVWAGLAWGLSPLLLVPLAFGHDAYVVAASLLPLLLLAVERLFAARAMRGAMGAALSLAALAGLQALTGHPQVVAYSGATVLAFALERAVRTRHAGRVVLAAGALAWGAAISMAVWWPALAYGAHSVRGGTGVAIEAVRNMSIAWRELPAFFLPRIVGGWGETYWGGLHLTDYPRFLGTSVTLFALVAAWGMRARDGVAREGRGLWLAVTLVAVALALGPRLGPLYLFLRDAFPVMAKFWVASMVLVVAALAVSLLSAAGLAQVLAAPAGPPRTRPHAAWLVPAVLFVLGAVLLAGGAPGYVALARSVQPELSLELARRAARLAAFDAIGRALLVALLFALLSAWRRGRLPAPLAAGALIVLLVADLAVVSLPTLRRASASESVLTANLEPALAGFGRREPAARVLSARVTDVSQWQTTGLLQTPEMRTNDWIRWRAHAHGGEHGTPPATWEELAFLGNTATLRALGIVYVSSPPDVPQDTTVMQRVASAPGENVYRMRGALSRAYAVRRVVALPSEREVARAMLADDFDPAREAYALGAPGEAEFPGSTGCRIEWLRDEPDSLRFVVDAPAAAFVVVADTWFPGWSATLDGQSVPIQRVNHSLRGVAVPAGAHELAMSYRPEGWELGRRVTRAAGALWLLAALALAAMGVRSRPVPPA